MFRDLKIRTKILAGFLIPILIGVVAAFINIRDLGQIKGSLVIVVVAISLALVIGIWLSHSISNSINSLREAAQEIAQGNLDKRIDATSKDEVGQLAQAFNQMTGSLLEARRLPENILRSMKDSLFVVNNQGNIIEANQAALDVLGYKKEELVGRPIKDIFKGGD